MSFAFEIKEEILEKEFTPLQAHAFISGLLSTSVIFNDSKYVLKINNAFISNVIKDLLDQLKIKYASTKENKNWIIFKNYSLDFKIKQPSYFFAGVFVSGGSISNIDSLSYHLEIQFYSHQKALKIQKFLNQYNFSFSLIKRRKMHVLYLKKSDQISDFLKAIQAFNSLMKFENSRIERDLHNQLNRYSNLDSYNQQKLAKASNKFKNYYEYIINKNLKNYFNEKEIIFFDLKLKNPYSSLEELKKIYKNKTNLKITKSALNHWLIKLRKIYEKN